MTGWYAERTRDGSGKAVIAVMMLALLLVAAVPVVLLAGLVMMLLGHVIGGLALFGGSILPPLITVPGGGMGGVGAPGKSGSRGRLCFRPAGQQPVHRRQPVRRRRRAGGQRPRRGRAAGPQRV